MTGQEDEAPGVNGDEEEEEDGSMTQGEKTRKETNRERDITPPKTSRGR